MSVEYYRKRIIDLRVALAKEKEAKKHDNEYYAERIRNAQPSSKASYRKSKIDRAAAHDRKIASIKHEIDMAKESLARERKK